MSRNTACALLTVVCFVVFSLKTCWKELQKDVFLTESISDDAETYCSVPYVARPSNWQDAHSGETVYSIYFFFCTRTSHVTISWNHNIYNKLKILNWNTEVVTCSVFNQRSSPSWESFDPWILDAAVMLATNLSVVSE